MTQPARWMGFRGPSATRFRGNSPTAGHIHPLDLVTVVRSLPPKGRRTIRGSTPSGEPAVLAGNFARLAVDSISDRNYELIRNLGPRKASASRSRP